MFTRRPTYWWGVGEEWGVTRESNITQAHRTKVKRVSRASPRTATFQSTRMGQRLYSSLGFEAVGRYEEWVPGENYEHITNRG